MVRKQDSPHPAKSGFTAVVNRQILTWRFLGRLAILPVCLALAATLGGCGGPSSGDALPTAPPNAATLVPPPTSTATLDPTSISIPTPTPLPSFVGSVAPDFAFKLFQGEDTLGDRELRLSDLRGQPVALNFWARFCRPCWSEMPELQEFYEEYEGQVRLLGIDVGQFTGLGSHKDAGKLLDSLGITYPAGYTDDAQVVPNYQIRAMPTTVFITAEGLIHRYWSGSIDRETVTAIVREMLEGD